MSKRKTQLLLIGIVSLLVWAGCDRNAATSVGTTAARKTADDRFAINVGARTVSMQVAALPEEMQQGLMYRKAMGEDEGMIFVFAQPQRMGFWMRHTEIPLEIGFFDAGGELKEIYDMYPHDENSVRSRSKDLQLALEMNQGWYGRNGVKPGARIDLAALADALRARGLKPEEFGLSASAGGS